MDKFLEMQTFAAVVDSGSFVKAADALSMSKAAVSRYVSDLEARLGVRLLHRTTRRLSLTDEGQMFHARCKELLAEVDDAEAEISARTDTASGTLGECAAGFGVRHLRRWGSSRAAPGSRSTRNANDRIVDLVRRLRSRGAHRRAARLTLVSRRWRGTLGASASPEYLKVAGTPRIRASWRSTRSSPTAISPPRTSGVSKARKAR
jgi:DNA-binding transcriptional LysR family regulator